jgi:hypothetical protein
MNKKNKIVIIVLAVILALSATFAGLTLNKGFLKKITGSLDAGGAGTQKMSDVLLSQYDSDYPLVETQQKDLFYEAYPDGTIKFFTYASGSFTEKTDIKTQNINFDSSNQTVKMKIYYTSTESGTVGYGLFDSKQDSNVKLYSYIFVRVADCPSAYSSYAKKDYVLFTDMDASDAYKTEKTYSDIYSLDLNTGNASIIMSNRDRTVQQDGTFRTDWVIFTDSSINSMDKSDLFASSRTHDIKADNREYDFMSVVNSRSMNKSTAATIVNSPDYHIWEKDGDSYCFVNSDNGFDLIKVSDKDSPLASFAGTFSDYAVSGEWILNKSTLDFTNVFSGESKSVKKATFTSFSGFIANPSGTKFILFCPGNTQSMIMYDTSAGTSQIVSDSDIFNSGICNFCFIDDNTFIVSSYNDANSTVNKICKF